MVGKPDVNDAVAAATVATVAAAADPAGRERQQRDDDDCEAEPTGAAVIRNMI